MKVFQGFYFLNPFHSQILRCKNRNRKKVKDMVSNIKKLHNGYLNKFKSVYTDNYAMKPFMLDDKLERDKNQPNFAKTGEVNDASSIHVRNAIARDNAVNAEKNVMLQSCGGYRFLFAICDVKLVK